MVLEQRKLLFAKRTLFQDQLQENFLVDEVWHYDKFRNNNVLYYGSSYKKMFKRMNGVVSYKKIEQSKSFLHITSLVCVTTLNRTKKFAVIKKVYNVVHIRQLSYYDGFSSSEYSCPVEETSNIICIFSSSILRKCVLSPHDKTISYVIKSVIYLFFFISRNLV